eukprot:Nitzschia sp. Nitz4//scaffold45_size130396//54893//55786//NITZ4_003446-RA/size130396-processed-gene-0.184-mRNA-1//1//CDS//3329552389//2317//frame0
MAPSNEKSKGNFLTNAMGSIGLKPKKSESKSSGGTITDSTPAPTGILPVGKPRQKPLDRWSDEVSEQWDAFCDYLEADDKPEMVQWVSKNLCRKMTVEAPVTVGFVFLCVTVHALNVSIFPGFSRSVLGVRQDFHFLHLWHYVQLLTQIVAHENMIHLRGNMTNILLVGPSTEKEFGSRNLIIIMVAVAISSGFGHVLFGPKNTSQIGASGVVFAMILLNSLVSASYGKIPVAFVLTAVMWAGDELWKLFFARDSVSHMAHLLGAVVGTIAGYMIQERRSLGITLGGSGGTSAKKSD